ncbi:MAG TPA: DNA polymerase III subunit beta, partial [Rickettsiales bacterium]|nr:DNA polymerase III subunit beta [Rickettsiales bacterium]
GTTTVPAQMFYDIIRKISDENIVKINQDNPNILQIISGKSKYNLPCVDASEFPSLAEGELEDEVEIDAERLAQMIDKTRFAISNDETRYYLNGLFLQSFKTDTGFELRTIATDGHRLAMAYLQTDVLKNPFGVILPKKSVNEVRRIIDGNEKARIAVSRAKIKITTNQTMIVSKLIDGEFPDYQKVLPQNNDKTATINKKTLFDCVDRVSTVASDKHKSVKMTLDNNQITLQINANDGSYAHEELEAQYQGDKIEIGFNSRYLLDVIGQVDKDELTMKFKDGNSPSLVEAVDFNAVYVIMPVRI